VPEHRIRLRGYWTVTALPDGRTRHTRHFGEPRTPPGETVWVVGELTGPARVSVNGDPLGEPAGAFAFEVTGRLRPRNELAIETAEKTLGEVGIAIRPS
jgi:hypothetical protein